MNIHHGQSRTRIYRCWTAMRARCSNPKDKRWKYYGARGIKVCERWSVFYNFYADMGDCPDGMSLDRINNDGDYEPKNCKWSTPKEQQLNRTNMRLISFGGKTMCHIDWARHLGITGFAFAERLRKWPLEKALTQSRMVRGPRPSENSRRIQTA